jgi:hypothetical protein
MDLGGDAHCGVRGIPGAVSVPPATLPADGGDRRPLDAGTVGCGKTILGRVLRCPVSQQETETPCDLDYRSPNRIWSTFARSRCLKATIDRPVPMTNADRLRMCRMKKSHFALAVTRRAHADRLVAVGRRRRMRRQRPVRGRPNPPHRMNERMGGMSQRMMGEMKMMR